MSCVLFLTTYGARAESTRTSGIPPKIQAALLNDALLEAETRTNRGSHPYDIRAVSGIRNPCVQENPIVGPDPASLTGPTGPTSGCLEGGPAEAVYLVSMRGSFARKCSEPAGIRCEKAAQEIIIVRAETLRVIGVKRNHLYERFPLLVARATGTKLAGVSVCLSTCRK